MMRYLRRGVIAVIPFSGIISMKSVAPIVELIEYAEKAPRIRGVLLNLSSQGGSVTATEVLVMALARLKEKKPLFVWTTMAASGGYYAASVADRIMAVPSAVIGSIGVIFIKPDISALMSRLGVKIEVLKEGALKDDTLFTRKMTPAGRKKIEAINREVYDDFVGAVARGRRLDEKAVRKIATGEVFTARRAKELGLVDELCDLRAATEALAREAGVKPRRVIQLRTRRPYLYSLLDRGVRTAVAEAINEIFGPGVYY